VANIAQDGKIADVIDKVKEVLGTHFTCYIGDFKSIDKLVPPVPVGSEQRLRNTCAIIEMLEPFDSHQVIRAWFIGRQELLDDRAPGVVIRESFSKVRDAAKEFIANG
jgi:hypothetical protein